MKQMDLATFSEYLDRFGSRFEHWPEDTEAAARLLLTDSKQAAQWLQQSQEGERLLGSLPAEPVPGGPESRILDRLPLDIWQSMADWFSEALWRAVAVAAMPLLLGFGIGLSQQSASEQLLADELSLLTLSASFEELPDEN